MDMTSTKFEEIMSKHNMHEKDEFKSIKSLNIFYQVNYGTFIRISYQSLHKNWDQFIHLAFLYLFLFSIEEFNFLILLFIEKITSHLYNQPVSNDLILFRLEHRRLATLSSTTSQEDTRYEKSETDYFFYANYVKKKWPLDIYLWNEKILSKNHCYIDLQYWNKV